MLPLLIPITPLPCAQFIASSEVTEQQIVRRHDQTERKEPFDRDRHLTEDQYPTDNQGRPIFNYAIDANGRVINLDNLSGKRILLSPPSDSN